MSDNKKNKELYELIQEKRGIKDPDRDSRTSYDGLVRIGYDGMNEMQFSEKVYTDPVYYYRSHKGKEE